MKIFYGEKSSACSCEGVPAEANFPEASALKTLCAHVDPHREDVVHHWEADIAHPVESRQAVDPDMVQFNENHTCRVIIRGD